MHSMAFVVNEIRDLPGIKKYSFYPVPLRLRSNLNYYLKPSAKLMVQAMLCRFDKAKRSSNLQRHMPSAQGLLGNGPWTTDKKLAVSCKLTRALC
jgi:hypothetical protein